MLHSYSLCYPWIRGRIVRVESNIVFDVLKMDVLISVKVYCIQLYVASMLLGEIELDQLDAAHCSE